MYVCIPLGAPDYRERTGPQYKGKHRVENHWNIR